MFPVLKSHLSSVSLPFTHCPLQLVPLMLSWFPCLSSVSLRQMSPWSRQMQWLASRQRHHTHNTSPLYPVFAVEFIAAHIWLWCFSLPCRALCVLTVSGFGAQRQASHV